MIVVNKLAIMQPYFFPYIGYFQLMNAVDAFVIYDDVGFVKRSWINRNYILAQGKKARFTLQLQGASQNVLINEVGVGLNKARLLKTLRHAYSRAPEFEAVFPLIEEIMASPNASLAEFLYFSLRRVCEWLGIDLKWYVSSSIKKDNSLKAQEKIIDICKSLGADHYVNLPGGRSLYDRNEFSNHGIQLSFIEPQLAEYQQGIDGFVSGLSIIDVMMFNSRSRCKELLKGYSIV